MILRRIGRGGMGDVYRAQDTRLHRNVALKVLRLDWIDEERSRAETVERMFREARAAAALEHPNVVVIHDVGEVTLEGATRPSYFIAMEYIDGAVLRSFVGAGDVPARGPRPLARRYRARARLRARARASIHRDVKPDNIMLRGGRRREGARLRDRPPIRGHGPAARRDAAAATLTEKGTALGTPRYMAPEQMLGRGPGRARRPVRLGAHRLRAPRRSVAVVGHDPTRCSS